MALRAIAAALNSARENLGDARPDTGQGQLGAWPTDGEHDCYVTSITVNEDDPYRIGFDEGADAPTTTPGCSIQFHFQLCDDPDNPEHPMEWNGQPIRLPNDITKIADKKRRGVIDGDRNRLCGHLTTILGQEVGDKPGMLNPATAIEQVGTLLEGEEQVTVTVRCETRKFKYKRGPRTGEPGQEKREKLLKKLSG